MNNVKIKVTCINESILLKSGFYSKANYDFYACRINDNYIDYMEKGITSLDYINPNLFNNGLFSYRGLIDSNQKENIKEILRKTKATIHSIIITIDDDTINSYKQCNYLLNRSLGILYLENGEKYNEYSYVAALHENTLKKHMHLLLYKEDNTTKNFHTIKTFIYSESFANISLIHFKENLERELSSPNFCLLSNQINILINEHKKLYEDYLIKKQILNVYQSIEENDPIIKFENQKELIKKLEATYFKINPDIKERLIVKLNNKTKIKQLVDKTFQHKVLESAIEYKIFPSDKRTTKFNEMSKEYQNLYIKTIDDVIISITEDLVKLAKNLNDNSGKEKNIKKMKKNLANDDLTL